MSHEPFAAVGHLNVDDDHVLISIKNLSLVNAAHAPDFLQFAMSPAHLLELRDRIDDHLKALAAGRKH